MRSAVPTSCTLMLCRPFLFTNSHSFSRGAWMWTTVRANSQRPATNPISGASSLMSFSTLLVENDPRPYMGFSQSLKVVSLDCVKPRLPSELASESGGLEVFTLDLVEAEPEDLSTQEHDNTPTPVAWRRPQGPHSTAPKETACCKESRRWLCWSCEEGNWESIDTDHSS